MPRAPKWKGPKIDPTALDGLDGWMESLAEDVEEKAEEVEKQQRADEPTAADLEEARWQQTLDEVAKTGRTEHVTYDPPPTAEAARTIAAGVRNGITYDADGNDVNAGVRVGPVVYDKAADFMKAAATPESPAPMPEGLRRTFEGTVSIDDGPPMPGTITVQPLPPVHGTMELQEGDKETDVSATATPTKIETMTRRSGSTGAHGIYAEARVVSATGALSETRRAFLAAEFLGMSTKSATAKGAQWAMNAHDDADNAKTAFEAYFAGLEVTAIVCELTSGDIDRLRRGVMPSLIYPAAGLLEEALEAFKDEVD